MLCYTVRQCVTIVTLCAGDLASSEWWERQDLVPPEPSPPENLQSVLADVFLEESHHQQNPFPASQPLPNLHLPKTAPPHSLLVRQACLLLLYLHCPLLTALPDCLGGSACSLCCALASVSSPVPRATSRASVVISAILGLSDRLVWQCVGSTRANAHSLPHYPYPSSAQSPLRTLPSMMHMFAQNTLLL